MGFVHLHNHSDHSFLDGAAKVGDLAKEAARMGMPALALTDHGNLCGAVEFHDACKAQEIKPIIGSEVYLTAGERTRRGADVYGKTPPIYHQTLIAKNEVGWKNLIKLSTLGFTEGFYRKPRIDYDLLHEHRDGIICLSGCMQSHLNQTLLKGEESEAMQIAGRLQDLFGEDFYLEIMDHDIEEEQLLVRKHLEFAKKINAKLVATNDTHYLKAEHQVPHDVLLCIGTRSNLADDRRMKFDGTGFHLRSEQEMRELFKEMPQACDTTLEVAEKVDFEFTFGEKHFPEFTLPVDTSASNDDEYLRELSEKGLKWRYDEVTDRIRDRLEEELGIIRGKQLASYFLIVRDFIEFARREKIPVGPGRGSAAGSLVSYLVGITNIDPMRYNLLFERFINPERESYPDIDVDFSDLRRGEVIEYVRQKYGEENVSQIITFGKMLSRAVVRDVGRVMGIPLGEVEAIIKKIPDPVGGKPPTLTQAMAEVPELRQLIESRHEYQEMMQRALVLEGTIRQPGVHAAGVVITPAPVSDFVPLLTVKGDAVVTQFDMNNVERLGLLKMDFLGLKTLSIIDKTLELLRRNGTNLELEEMPLDDVATYELFGRGDTIGIFQFESGGMRDNLRKLQPERLEDLIAMNALYRPGPMDNIDTFVARKHGKEKISYLHDSLSTYLDETYGIIVYQEQVMQIASGLGGMSLGRADLLRRAMGKKKLGLMNEMKPEFVAGCAEREINEKTANGIWDLIEKFASYGFNKSHAAAYSLLAYQTGYFKVHHPAEFFAAALTVRKDNTDEVVLFLDECRRMGVKVLAPDINVGVEDFTVDEEGSVVFGLAAIKGVGSAAIAHVSGERDSGGPFKDLFDLTGRVEMSLVNRTVVMNLIYAGALDTLPGNRAQKLGALDGAIAFGQQAARERANGQVSIFGGEEVGAIDLPTPELPDVEELPTREKLREERARLGFYFSGHPLARHRSEIEALASASVRDLDGSGDGQEVRLAGLLSNIEVRPTRRGDKMARCRFEDLTGNLNAIIFPRSYEEFGEQLNDEEPVLVEGRIQVREDQRELVVEGVQSLVEAARRRISGVQVTIDTSVSGQALLRLEQELRNHPGNSRVAVLFRDDEGRAWRMMSGSYHINPTSTFLQRTEELFGAGAVRLYANGG